jgi:tetratricopeptide (TPR) repeat protein
MAEAKLSEIRNLKEKATALRKREQYDRALATLDEAIHLLDDLRHTTDTKEIRTELADTHGMIGGVHRRQQDLYAALAAYRRGRQIEDIDKASTYNLSNEITLGIATEGVSPTEPNMRNDLEIAIERLTAETQGRRKDEWWAWSDLAQFYLLANKLDQARDSYSKALARTGVTTDEIHRHATILQELASRIADKAPEISNNIRKAITDLTQYQR